MVIRLAFLSISFEFNLFPYIRDLMVQLVMSFHAQPFELVGLEWIQQLRRGQRSSISYFQIAQPISYYSHKNTSRLYNP